jgi:hypothetical protein
MKLKGEVEVFKILKDGTSESVLKESNMVVDGASEVIVDMLTTPFSIKNVAGSETLNPSNFTVQAVTLGKASQLYGGQPETSAADTNVIGMHTVYNNSALSDTFTETDPGALLGQAWIGARNSLGNDTSSWFPSRKLPKAPFPGDVALEDSSKTQIELYYEQFSGAASASLPETVPQALPFGVSEGWNHAANLLPSRGHNLNALWGLKAKSMESMFQGCYAPSDGMDVYLWTTNLTRRSVVTAVDPESGMLASVHTQVNNVSGRYNTLGSMDREGYLVAYPIQDHPASGDGTNGVIVSAARLDGVKIGYMDRTLGTIEGSGAFIVSPAVSYSFTISSTDLLSLAAYKGVTNIGLWAFDQKETYKNESPPIDWSVPTNNRKYKLFAKKTFSEDLTTIQDNASKSAGIANYSDLKIQWRLNFAFGETF